MKKKTTCFITTLIETNYFVMKIKTIYFPARLVNFCIVSIKFVLDAGLESDAKKIKTEKKNRFVL